MFATLSIRAKITIVISFLLIVMAGLPARGGQHEGDQYQRSGDPERLAAEGARAG
jgi:hypothetical protein